MVCWCSGSQSCQVGEFLWLLEPDFTLPEIDKATWYFDGSMLNGKSLPLRSTGFGLAAISESGQLLACGRGTPPHWCATAAAAEAWALLQVFTMLPFPPEMRTDCMALLHTIRGSTIEAGSASRQLARIWRDVADALGGCFKALHEAQQLVWVPAHTTTSAVGEAKLSNGSRLSMFDWRANRLVDALAKMSALEAQYLPEALRLIRSSEVAVKYAAMLLGRTTHACNNHVMVITDETGKESNKVLRDAMPAPLRPKRRLSPKSAKTAPVQVATLLHASNGSVVLPPPLKAARLAGGHTSRNQLAKQFEAECLQRRVDDIGSSLSNTAAKLSACDRLAALRHRKGIPRRSAR
jgi:hypothetical protein